MVTHSMHQAASLGDRLIMMYRGRVIHDFRGAQKRRLRVDDLLARFEEVRRGEQLDESAAEMPRRAYVTSAIIAALRYGVAPTRSARAVRSSLCAALSQ